MKRQRLRGLLALALCLLVVAVINAVSRDDEPGSRWYTGPVGTVVTSPAFDVIVHQVDLAQTVADGHSELTTPGVFVVVHWSVSAKQERALLSDVELHTQTGLAVTQRSEMTVYSGIRMTEAGFTSHGASVFEVHAEDLPGAVMRVAVNRGFFYTFGGGVEIRDLVAPNAEVRQNVSLPDAMTEVTR